MNRSLQRKAITRRPCFAALLMFAPVLAGCSGAGHLPDPRVRAAGSKVQVDAAPVAERGFEFYTYRSGSGVAVDFFLYRDGTGTLRAALDACRKCYRWKRGYSFEGEYVLCRKCGERYSIDSLHEGRGSCIPISLTSTEKDGLVLIPIEELEAAAAYF